MTAAGTAILTDIKAKKQQLKAEKRQAFMDKLKSETAHFIESVIVPLVAKTIMAALALKGLSDFLPNLDSRQQIAAAVVTLAMLAYIAFKKR